ncbi:transglycosylase domain-containing protein [Actinophytocola sp.]|uniref:transglycosylase domain-containing protein n=1 Tax=Actinophytocola sp. TaxID=1872138 RepID=UPI002ED40D44
MNDHRNHRHRASEPAWPTGDDPKPRASAQGEERTGFWSPLWENDDDDAPAAQHTNGRANGRHERSNGHARKSGGEPAGGHQWPAADEPPPAPRRPEPPAQPRPAARRGAAPVWPSAEESPTVRRPGGPHTPPPPGGRKPGPPGGPTTQLVRPPRPAGPPRPGARPGVDPDGPTELMRPTNRGGGPEPQLLTHRELDYDEDLNDDPDLYDDEDYPLSDGDRRSRKKKIWRRVRRTMYVLTALGIIGPIIAFFVAYQMVEVPTPQQVAAKQEQVVTLLYGNDQQMSQIVPEDGTRQFVKYDDIPDTVKHAVFAAEDAEFMTNPGFDISGVMRAGWDQVSGGKGGGSTITQQYIKKATGDDEVSYSRKALEVVKAYKMNNTYSKEAILEAYLNTIYFGRSANGIAAAAKAYYGKNLDQLSPSEAALLAGMIQTPGKYKDEAYMQRRWKFVMDQMVDKGWLSAADRKAAVFPAASMIPVENARPKAIEGSRAHIQNAVLKEVEKEAGLSVDELRKNGYIIKTTIDPAAQDMAEAAVTEVLTGQPDNLRSALVAVNPANGEVVAYYGGAEGNGLDWAGTPQEPGSSFKPFDLVALLQTGRGLAETYDGSNNRVFNGQTVRNAGGDSCGEKCTVALAMKKSINTVFYDMAVNDVGTRAVANAAAEAGIQTNLMANGDVPDGNIAIGGGKTQVSTLEMASAYSTFAANGIYHKPHLVKQILTPDGKLFWEPGQAATEGKAAFDPNNSQNNQKIARNVTEALMPIPEFSKIPLAGKRPVAGKTGTHQYGETKDNAKAWMVGYTPQISTAVSLAATDPTGTQQMPVRDKEGNPVSGAKIPGKIWQTFMNNYLKDLPKTPFIKFSPIGKALEDEDGESKKNSTTNPPTQNDDGNNGRGNDGDNNNNDGDNNNGQTTTQPTDPTDTQPTDPTETDPDPGNPNNILPTGRTSGG